MAWGVKLANPDRPGVAVVGDASSMITAQALATAANANIPVVYVICNNRTYRVLRLNMNVYKRDVRGEEQPRSRYMATDFPIPLNIAGIADLAPAVRQALDLGGTAVLGVSIDGSI